MEPTHTNTEAIELEHVLEQFRLGSGLKMFRNLEIQSNNESAITYRHYICLFTFASVLYLNSLGADFAYDDSRAIQNNQDILPNTPWYKLFTNDFWGTPIRSSNSHGSYRPIAVFTFRLNYLLHGLNPFGFHLFNLILHLIVTLVYMKFISRVLNGRKRITLIASFLFASHPIHVESVTSIVGRADLGAALFYLLALLSYRKFVDTELERTASTTGTKYLLASTTFATMSMLTKEHGVTCLPVCAVYHLFIIHRFFPLSRLNLLYLFQKAKYRQLRHGLLFLAISFVSLVTVRLVATGAKRPSFAPADNPASDASSVIVRFLTFLYLPAFNVWLLIYPRWLSFDWSMEAIPLVSSFDYRNIYTILFYSTIGWLAFKIFNFITQSSKLESKPAQSRCLRCESVYKQNGSKFIRNLSKFDDNNNNSSAINYNHIGGDYASAVGVDDPNNNNGSCINYESPSLFQPTSALPKLYPNKPSVVLSRLDCFTLSLALTVIPFLPATNLFFYVGFVVAERILYIPSLGFCLFVAICIENVFKFFRKSHSLKCLIYVSLLVLLVSFSARTVLRNVDWLSEENLYRSGIAINAPKAYGNLGNIFSAQGKKEEAEWAYRKALDYRVNMADVHYNLGILLQEQKRYRESFDSYKSAIRFRPRLAVAHLNLAIVLTQLGQREQAKRVYRQCADLDGTGLKDIRLHENTRISALYNLGRMYIDESEYEKAIEVFNEAVSRMPHYYQPQSLFNVIGETYFKMNRTKDAEKWFQKSLAIKGNHIPAHLTYAKMLIKLNRTMDAEKLYLKAIRIDPNDTLIYQHFGQFAFNSGRYEQALELFQKATSLSADNFDLIVSMANTLRELKRNKEAEKFYEKATKLKPDDVIGHSNLGAIYHLNGKYREAEASYLRALKLKPDDLITNTNLAKLKQAMSKRQ